MPASPLSLKSYVHTFPFPTQGLQTPNDSKLFSPALYTTITLWNFRGCFVRHSSTNEVLFILHTDFSVLFCLKFLLVPSFLIYHTFSRPKYESHFSVTLRTLNEQDFLWSVIFNNNEILETPLGVLRSIPACVSCVSPPHPLGAHPC